MMPSRRRSRSHPARVTGLPDQGLSARESLAILTASVTVLIVAAFLWNLCYERGVAVDNAGRAAINLTDSLAQQASDSFEAVDSALLALTGRVETDGTDDAQRARLREAMAAQIATMSRLHQLIVADSHGRQLLDNNSAAARPDLHYEAAPYFAYHRDHASKSIHISGPDWIASEKHWLIHVTRRIDRKDGGFGGVAIAQIAVDYFQQIYGTIDVGRAGVIALASDDGTVLVREPARLIGQNVQSDVPMFSGAYEHLPAGTFVSRSPIDGVQRLSAFRRVWRYPILAIVALSSDDYLADWRSAVWKRSSALGLVLLLIATLGFGLDLQMRKRKRAEESLARLALIDALTGLANRRQFDAVLAREWRLAGRDDDPLALLMIDVDEFKIFNDNHGHQRGDEILTTIAMTIASCTYRAGDFCARYGGEEFAVILPGTSASNAVAIGERIRRAVFDLDVVNAGSALGKMSVSVGVCAMVPTRSDAPGVLIRAADAALYGAKRAGRNTTRVPSEAVEQVSAGGIGSPPSS
jgi:diguanylate cyclase (GGDEF)-like protein